MRGGSGFLSDVRLQEVEKEVMVEEPGMKPKKQKIMAMDYLYEQELEGSLTFCPVNAFRPSSACRWGEASSQQRHHFLADERTFGVQSLTSRAS